jgi:hypothetical protein
MDTVPVSNGFRGGSVTTPTPVGEACAVEVDPAVAEARAVLDATGVRELVETGNAVKSDSMGVGVA